MRLKEYLISVVIFTIIYILFFIIYDFISLKLLVKQKRKKAYKRIDNNSYLTFSAFYGLNPTLTKDQIKKIYDKYKNESNLKISETAVILKISINELIVVILFLEYLDLIPVRNIFLQGDSISPLTSIDQTMINKYNYYIENKQDFNTIKQNMGVSAVNDLVYFDTRFIYPGVRVINSVIYYVGDINEKK